MRQIHHRDKKLFQELFHREHIDQFEDRFKILEAFLQTEKHLTIEELHRVLLQTGNRLSVDFVRDTLLLMCRFGFAQKRKFEDGHTRYEHRHLGQHHDHMICTRCGQIIEFQNENMELLQNEIAGTYGFHMLQHTMEIYGICSGCLSHRRKMMPLVNAKPGERLIISEFSGGKISRMRMMTMGLRVGDKAEVITNNRQGQLVVAIDYKRFSLGRGMAMKILVEPDPQ
ncbi:MAG: transcriptional repressor [Deltaproteobacteria bacterium]|nr:transcriptional repressor [Deltaproteobacteria bacterium]